MKIKAKYSSDNPKLLDLYKSIFEDLQKRLDEIIIEGLRLKGYKFKNRKETQQFIYENCKVEENSVTQNQVFFVKGKPFLLLKHDNSFPYMISQNGSEPSYVFTSGYFKYL